MKKVPFRVLAEGEQRAPNRDPRRHWAPIIETLLEGFRVFIADAHLTPKSIKYLQLRFLRLRKLGKTNLYLRSAHVEGGYELWTEREPLR